MKNAARTSRKGATNEKSAVTSIGSITIPNGSQMSSNGISNVHTGGTDFPGSKGVVPCDGSQELCGTSGGVIPCGSQMSASFDSMYPLGTAGGASISVGSMTGVPGDASLERMSWR